MKTVRSNSLMLILAGSFLVASPAMADGPNHRIDPANLAKLAPAQQERVQQIADRWEAIAAMDRNNLDRADRKELRAEVKALKAEAREINRDGTVIYLSSAAIIIIILLLILLI